LWTIWLKLPYRFGQSCLTGLVKVAVQIWSKLAYQILAPDPEYVLFCVWAHERSENCYHQLWPKMHFIKWQKFLTKSDKFGQRIVAEIGIRGGSRRCATHL